MFGLLGPNGAGKTTIVEILEGLRQRDAGDVCVLGLDPDHQKKELKNRIGVCLQATNLPAKIRVKDTLKLFAAFYTRKADLQALLHRFRLGDKKGTPYDALSGGQKQRLAFALALVNEPQLLFLDEPTAGLDPQTRRQVHEIIAELRGEKRTILLTTHYIEEAERLCDRVAIIDLGKIRALGSPRELRERSGGQGRIEIKLVQSLSNPRVPDLGVGAVSSVSNDGRHIKTRAAHLARALVELVKWVDTQGGEIEDVRLNRPTLEDIFIELTGRELRD